MGKKPASIQRPGAELTPREQHDLVVAYFEAVGRIESLERQIDRIYADPSQSDPAAAVAPLESELSSLRTTQSQRRPAVERILELQTTTILGDEGLTTLDRVAAGALRVFREPGYLIVSPRTRILVQESVDPAPSPVRGTNRGHREPG